MPLIVQSPIDQHPNSAEIKSVASNPQDAKINKSDIKNAPKHLEPATSVEHSSAEETKVIKKQLKDDVKNGIILYNNRCVVFR